MTVTTGDGQSVQLSTDAYPAGMATRYIMCTKSLCFFRVTNSDTGTLICHSEDIRALAIAIQAVGSEAFSSATIYLGTGESDTASASGSLDKGRPQYIGDSRWFQEWNTHLNRPGYHVLTLANSEVVCKTQSGSLVWRSDDYEDILAGILDSIISKHDGDAAEADWVALKEEWGI